MLGTRSGAVAILAGACLASPAAAQAALEAQTGSPPERIDILVETAPPADEYEDCERDQDAATISGEIIVCRKRSSDENRLYDRESSQRRHAERTAFEGDPKSPDFILDCQDQGWPFGCFKLGGAPTPVLLIDVEALPEAPLGSDADRIGRGLAPRGDFAASDGSNSEAGKAGSQANAEELGLPPPHGEEPSPSESASPADEPSG